MRNDVFCTRRDDTNTEEPRSLQIPKQYQAALGAARIAFEQALSDEVERREEWRRRHREVLKREQSAVSLEIARKLAWHLITKRAT